MGSVGGTVLGGAFGGPVGASAGNKIGSAAGSTASSAAQGPQMETPMIDQEGMSEGSRMEGTGAPVRGRIPYSQMRRQYTA